MMQLHDLLLMVRTDLERGNQSRPQSLTAPSVVAESATLVPDAKDGATINGLALAS